MRIILIDQDGPLAQWEQAFYTQFRDTFPDLPYIEPSQRRDHKVFEEYANLVEPELRDDMRAKVRSIYLAPGFYENLAPVEGAREALFQMLELGFVPSICTAPLRKYENCVLEKFRWVEKHLGSEFTDRMILCRTKSLVRGEFLIDDRPDLHTADGIDPLWKPVIYDMPYNRQVTDQLRLVAWKDWRAVLGV